MQIRRATFIRRLDRGIGEMRLYRVTPAHTGYEYLDQSDYEYVVVSATGPSVNNFLHDDETYIFPSNKDGEIVNWSEMPGSFRGGWDHELALENAGYVVDREEEAYQLWLEIASLHDKGARYGE